MTPTKDHGTLGENIKVHFAGAEGYERAYICHDTGVKYFLFTVLPFIMNQFSIKWGHITYAKEIPAWRELPKISNHVIMDSGLFSLMFGACKNVRPDEKFIRRYEDAICDFVNENKAFSFTCVECDCQKLLGTELAWELRTRMREQIPNRIINVFHYEDGKYGLDRLIEFAEYIAISVPELRIVKPKTYKEDTYRLASYIKEKKPEIDIHLLGGTEFEMLKRCRFCTSADSTSWVSGLRYGNILKGNINRIKKDVEEEMRGKAAQIMKDLKIEPSEAKTRTIIQYYLSAKLYLNEYRRFAGNQD